MGAIRSASTVNDMAETDPLLGRTVGGKFVIEHFLGGGAMGSVYRAKQIALEKDVAVKVLHHDMARDPAFVARFHREAMAASRLDHPSSVRVIDFGEDNGLLYIVMEYLAGRDLLTVMNEEWPLDDRRVAIILSQVLAALAVAHDQGIVHRDLKPENIMVLEGTTDDGEPMDLVKVCDFGIATIAGASDEDPSAPKLTAKGLVMGTPDYMSPEQARGEKLDARSDLYSVGVILYHLLTGRTPFAAENAIGIALKHVTEPVTPPSATTDDVDAQLEKVCLRSLEKSREARYQSARQMRGDLRTVLEAHGASLPPIPSARTGSGGTAVPASSRRKSDGAAPPSRPGATMAFDRRAGTIGYAEPPSRGGSTMAFESTAPPSARARRLPGPNSQRGSAPRNATLPALPAPDDAPEIIVTGENPMFDRDAQTAATPALADEAPATAERAAPFPALSSNEIQVMVDDNKSAPTSAPAKKKSRAGVIAAMVLVAAAASGFVFVRKNPQLLARAQQMATPAQNAPAVEAPIATMSVPPPPIVATPEPTHVVPPPVVESADPAPSAIATAGPHKGQKIAIAPKATAKATTTATAAITAAPEPTPTATVTAAPTPTVTAAPAPTPTVTAAPKVSIDPTSGNVAIAGVSTSNGLNSASVRNTVSHAVGAFTKCYRDALTAKNTPASGTGYLTLHISESGTITAASLSAGFISSAKACIEGAARGLRVKDVDTGEASANVTLSFTHK